MWPSVRSIAWLAGLTAAFVVPVWVVLGEDLTSTGGGTTFSTCSPAASRRPSSSAT